VTTSAPHVHRPSARPGRNRREVLAHRETHHPAVVALAERHAASVQLRVAGVVFAVWMLFFEKSPWPTLTLVVSLEAIFLSTFVMIGQNRQATFQQEKADHDFNAQEKELDENTVLTREIHRLTVELHALQSGKSEP
jgi:uncharacterized membrane protein